MGIFATATCTHCFAVYPGEPLIRQFLQDHIVPRCEKCGGVIKPNVILFGEQLPFRELQAAQEAARRADVMLIVGSSLEVSPASDLPQIALQNGAKLVIVNLTPTDFDRRAYVVLHADAAEVLPADHAVSKGSRMTITRPERNQDDETTFSQLLARYERIIEIGQQLNSTRDHVALLRRIISAAMELIDTETASILLIDPSTGELRFELAANMDQEMSNIVVPMEGSIAGWVVTHGEARVIEDVTQEPSFFKSVDDILEFHTQSVLAVPLRST